MIKFFSTILFTLIYIPLAASAGPTIMTSIKPVAMLIKAVVGDEIPVEVLLSGNVSPTTISLSFQISEQLEVQISLFGSAQDLKAICLRQLKTIHQPTSFS